jgi:hypothetical protein
MGGYGGIWGIWIWRGIQRDTAGYSGIWEIQRDTVGYSGIQQDLAGDTAGYSGIQLDIIKI